MEPLHIMSPFRTLKRLNVYFPTFLLSYYLYGTNVIYAPFRCFATVVGMLPYRGKEASERSVGSIGTECGKHRNE